MEEIDKNQQEHLFNIIAKEGFILNSESLNEWIFQKANFQLTLNKL